MSDLGDEIVRESLEDGNEGAEFIPDKKFSETLTKESLGYLKIRELKPEDLSLDFTNPISSLNVNSTVQLKISSNVQKIKPSSVQSLRVEVKNKGKLVDVESSHWSQFSFNASAVGDYEISATLYDKHIKESPMAIPIVTDARAVVEKLGLTLLADSDQVLKTSYMSVPHPSNPSHQRILCI